MPATTTIKVSPDLRDRINHDAKARGLTAAGFLEQLIEDYEHEQMLLAFGRAFNAADESYRSEITGWAAMETEWPGD